MLHQGFKWSQVSFLLRKKLSRQTRVCFDKTRLLSWQKYVCLDKTFVATNIFRDKHNFVTTKVLSWQAYFCCDKHVPFVITKHIFCRGKSMLVMTEPLSWQTCVCCDKIHKHNFITTKVLLKQAYFCHDKRCVLSWQTRVCSNKKTQLWSHQK